MIGSVGISYRDIYGIMRDSVATNGAALNVLEGIARNFMDMNCLSHTIDHVGEHLNIPEAHEAVSILIQLHSMSAVLTGLWAEFFGIRPPSVTNTRWWSRYEFAREVSSRWRDIGLYIQALEDRQCCSSLVRRLRDLLSTGSNLAKIERQLSVSAIVMTPFIKATYDLEGDGFLLPLVFDVLECLTSLCSNPTATLDGLININPENFGWIQPAFDYFKHRMSSDHSTRTLVYQFARIFNPEHATVVQPSKETFRQLASIFPWNELRDEEVISGMFREFPLYQSRSATFKFKEGSTTTERARYLWNWCERQKESLPMLCSVVSMIALLQPSSGAMERVYSLVRNSFSDKQAQVGSRYFKGTVMSQFNDND